MSTQVSFTVANAAVKEKAWKRAKSEGITIKALLNFCMNAYAENTLSLGILPSLADTEFTEANKRAWKKARKDLENGVNIVSWEEMKEKYAF
ncbi:MAG: hypothetical protein WCJ84_03515 [Candidatus Peregrinibacteria bacterium]